MEYGKLLTRAWDIVWRWKVLWILGFLAALGQSTGGANSGYNFSSRDFQNGNLPNLNLSPGAEGLIITLACLGIILAIALWVVSVIARGGLIAGVAQIEEEGSTSLGRAWAAGQSRFWTLFGIGILMAIPVLLLVAAMLIGIFLIAGTAIVAGVRGSEAAGPIIASVFACLCPSVCLLVVVGILLGQIRIYAERAAVLEHLGWIDAFRRGWQVLRSNLGATVVLWLIFLLLGLLIAAIVAALIAPIALPLAALSAPVGTSSAPNWALLAPICGLGLLAVIIGAIVGSVVNAFTSATWTLAYRQMTGRALPAVLPETPAPPAPPSGFTAEG